MKPDQRFELIRVHYGTDPCQFADLRLPAGDGPHPVLVVIHGGFWKAQYGLDLMDDMSEDFARRGFATWNIEYRRVGNPGGGWPGTLQDVAAAADHLRNVAADYPLDLQTVLVIGHSAGGHLALWLAGRHRIRPGSPVWTNDPLPLSGVVSLAGATDLYLMDKERPDSCPTQNFLGGTPEEHPDRYRDASPSALLPLGLSQVLVHGTADDSVPVILSQSYAKAATDAGDDVRFVQLNDVDHFQVIDPGASIWGNVVEAVESLLRYPSPESHNKDGVE